MNTLIMATSSGGPFRLQAVVVLFLLALVVIILGVPYLAFKAWRSGRVDAADGGVPDKANLT